MASGPCSSSGAAAMKTDFSGLDVNISRARIALSLVALVSVYVDPAAGGAFHISRYALITLGLHLLYGSAACLAVSRGWEVPRFSTVTTALDVLFAGVVAMVTEGSTSPSSIFFVFAIIAVDCRTGFRAALTVTVCSGIVYFLLLALSTGHVRHLYAMRAAYLTIIGYLIGFIGKQRAAFEARARELETAAERHRIARSLHDGYVQALAGMGLRLETCRELLARNRGEEAMRQLGDLQAGVSREFDQVRSYVRSLANLDQSLSRVPAWPAQTRFRIQTAFAASAQVVEQIMHVMLEGMRNAMRHGNACSGIIDAREDEGIIRITIEDDGVGFADPVKPPWAIASRVAECGGRLKMGSAAHRGAYLEIEMPVG